MWTIVLFTKIQVDTAISYFLLTMFGEQAFPGIGEAKVEFWTELPDLSVEELESRGYILIDLGMSRFDHHRLGPENNKITSAYLVAEHLGIQNRPDIQKLLELARRDDLEGKGTISQDPIDRAFGLSALLTNLNKSIPDQPQAVLDLIIPLITGHYLEENRRHELLPKEYNELVAAGKLNHYLIDHTGRKLKVVLVESDNPALAGYLRSSAVGAGLVIQKTSTGHINFIANQNANVKLHKLAGMIKTREAQKNNIAISHLSREDMEKSGRTEGLPHWYYDTRANTLQNGGINPKSIPPTLLDIDEVLTLVQEGLNVPHQPRPANRSSNQNRPPSRPSTPSNHKFTHGKGVTFID